jgi:hypothetical protein
MRGLSYKLPARRFTANESGVDDLESYWISKIDLNRFVSNAQRATTELESLSIVVRQDIVMFEAKLRWRKTRLNG